MKRLVIEDTVLVDAVLRELEAQGSEENRRMHARYGVSRPTFGVPYRELKKLQKQLRMDQALAEQLWESGYHDARLLATLIAEPQRLTPAVADRWTRECDDDALAEALCALMWRSPIIGQCAPRWRVSPEPWVAIVGWCVTRHQAPALENQTCEELITLIGEHIADMAPRVQHQMNLALIALGVRGDDELRDLALVVAGKIGPLAVDDPRGDRTPDAANEIRRGSRMKNRA
ncbi:MAG: DNA alkylation repair protein [Acidimicrobiia bacterium]